MKRKILAIAVTVLAFAGIPAQAQEYSWSYGAIDGSRTGCVSTMKDNVFQSLGNVADGVYHAPNGTSYPEYSLTAKVASLLLDAQPRMAHVKEVIAYAPKSMKAARPESDLSNWFVDLVMKKVENLSGKKIDVGICNYGGIRAEIPQGYVILDDILSMFPFDNTLYYVQIKGKDLREIFEGMASRKQFEVLGGVRIVVCDDKIKTIHVGEEPLDDERVYSVASISFLYEGGDKVALAPVAVSAEQYDIFIREAVLEHIKTLTDNRQNIEYSTDGRIVYETSK